MNCKNCGMQLTTSNSGPKPYISIRPDGSYGSYMCVNGKKLYVEGHQPEGISNVTAG